MLRLQGIEASANAPSQVEKFVDEECLPGDAVYAAQLGEGAERWSSQPSVLDDLKEKAKKVGIWNMFLPKNHFKEGAGFSNLEYGLIAEELGKSRTASEVSQMALHSPKSVNTDTISRPRTALLQILVRTLTYID